MPQYRVLEPSFVNNSFHEEGDVIDYDPPKDTTIGNNLELVEEPKKGNSEPALA